jgi:hypothetical protein
LLGDLVVVGSVAVAGVVFRAVAVVFAPVAVGR